MQENWIGRSEGLRIRFAFASRRRAGAVPGGFHHPPRHAVRRLLHGALARSSARGGARRARSGARRLHRGVPPHRHRRRRRSRRRRSAATTPACRSAIPSMPDRLLPVYVANFIADGLRHRRDLRLPGARPARPRLRPQIRAAGHARSCCPTAPIRATFAIGDEAYLGDGRIINSGFLDGMTRRGGEGGGRRAASEARRVAGEPQAAREVNYRLRDWGISRQRYWGCPIPMIHCADLRRRAGAARRPAGDAARRRRLRPARQSARPPPDLAARRLPALRRPGAARDRHDGHLRRFVLVFRPLHRAARADADRARAPSIAGCRSTSISAASSTRSCISSIRASSPAPCSKTGHVGLDEPFAGLFTQGMVVHETYRNAAGEWRRAGEVRIEGEGDARRAFSRDTGEPVEIGPIEKMSKSKRNTVDPSDIIASYGADTARWFMLSDSPPERDVIWTEAGVEGAHRFVQRVWRLVAPARGRAAAAAPAAPGACSARRRSTLRRHVHRTIDAVTQRHRAAALQPRRRASLRADQRADRRGRRDGRRRTSAGRSARRWRRWS